MTQKVPNVEVKKRLNLKNDIIFKAFFSRKGNEKYLIDFLNSILKIKITEIEIKEEVNLEKLSEIEKGGRLDIQAILNDGIIVNIEMQMRDLENIEERNDIYKSKTMSRDFEKGEDYKEARKVISINILNYNLFGFKEYISETTTVLKEHRDFEVNSLFKTYFIELPKFRESNPDMDDKLNQWLVFIDDTDRGKIKMAEEKNKILKQAKIEMNYLTGDNEVRRIAELQEKWESDRVSELSYATRKGEKKSKLEIAKRMLEKNKDIEEIIELTELTKEEIESLK